MLHHHRDFTSAVAAERAGAAARRRAAGERDGLEDVVRAAARGEERAWAALAERFAKRVRATARAHRLSPDDVEDVVQTTWLRLLEHLPSIRRAECVGAWLETTARHESLRVLRTRSRERASDEDLAADVVDDATATDELALAARRAAVHDALGRLPSRQRELLTQLIAEPARSYDEISRRLEMPIGSIGPTRARGIARLREDPALLEVLDGEAA